MGTPTAVVINPESSAPPPVPLSIVNVYAPAATRHMARHRVFFAAVSATMVPSAASVIAVKTGAINVVVPSCTPFVFA